MDIIKTIKEKRILNISSQPKQNALSTDTSKNNEILTTSKNTEDNFSAKTMSLNSSKTNTRSSIELGCRVFNTELGEGVVQSYSSSQNKYLVRFGNKTKLLSSNLLKVVSKKRSSTFGSPLKQTTVSEKIVIPEDSGVISYRWTVAKSIIDLNTKMAYIRSNNDIKMYIIPLYGINVIALDIPSELDSSCIVSVEMFFNLKTKDNPYVLSWHFCKFQEVQYMFLSFPSGESFIQMYDVLTGKMLKDFRKSNLITVKISDERSTVISSEFAMTGASSAYDVINRSDNIKKSVMIEPSIKSQLYCQRS